jgi:hypothetical protein
VAENKVYVGDLGTEILVDTCQNITAATVVRLDVLKPGATTPVTWVGTVANTTQIRHVLATTDVGDITKYDASVPGTYRVQPYVVLPGGIWRGATATFIVYAAFE